MTKYSKIVEWMMRITISIIAVLIPTAIFVPIYISTHYSHIDVSMYRLFIGAFILLFVIIYLYLGSYILPDFIKKEGKDDA